MLRDITRATNAVVFSFLFCFVRSRVSFAKSVDDNVERTLVLLFIFVIFFFFSYYCAPKSIEDRSMSPVLLF